MNAGATHVHRAMSSSTRTSDAPMIFASAHCHLEASNVEPTFGAISPWLGVLRLIRT
jgi:hypothetical protein